MSSPRKRFVEAINAIGAHMDERYGRFNFDFLRDAVTAFADAVCQDGGDDATCCLATDGTIESHAACRASLLRDCGLEES